MPWLAPRTQAVDTNPTTGTPLTMSNERYGMCRQYTGVMSVAIITVFTVIGVGARSGGHEVVGKDGLVGIREASTI